MTPNTSLQQQTLAQVTALNELVHSLDKKIDQLTYEVGAVAELSKKHERTLYRQNGDPGLLDEFEYLKESVDEHHSKQEEENALIKSRQENSLDERRKLLYGLLASIILMGIDIAIHLIPGL